MALVYFRSRLFLVLPKIELYSILVSFPLLNHYFIEQAKGKFHYLKFTMTEALIQLHSLWVMSLRVIAFLCALCIVHKAPSALTFFFQSFSPSRFSGTIRRGCPFASRGLLYLAAGLFPATLVAAAPTPGAEVALPMPVQAMLEIQAPLQC